MIEGSCHTNLDDFKICTWPTKFVAVPRVGEWVQATNNGKVLQVAKVTHLIAKNSGYVLGNPIISVELRKAF